MHLRALVAAAGLAAACGTDHAQVEPIRPTNGIYMKVVDHGSTQMQQLYETVPTERPAGIAAAIDRWRTDDGRTYTDPYLTGPSPEAIKAYVEPRLTVADDHELAFQQIGDHWRTYWVFRTAELDAGAVAHAHASLDPNTQRPVVMLDFTPTGARQFGDLTARIAGHKLAVLADGRVVAAPVITGAISGGHAAVTLDASATEAAATALAQTLEPR